MATESGQSFTPKPDSVERRDYPDGRTRLEIETVEEERVAYFHHHRVIDLATGGTVLDGPMLRNCQAQAEWRDGALDFAVPDLGLDLRIDLARGEFRDGGQLWHPIAELQPTLEAAESADRAKRQAASRRWERRQRWNLPLAVLFFGAAFGFFGWVIWLMIRGMGTSP